MTNCHDLDWIERSDDPKKEEKEEKDGVHGRYIHELHPAGMAKNQPPAPVSFPRDAPPFERPTAGGVCCHRWPAKLVWESCHPCRYVDSGPTFGLRCRQRALVCN